MTETLHLEIDSPHGAMAIVCNPAAMRGYALLRSGLYRLLYLKREDDALRVATTKAAEVRSEKFARAWVFPEGTR